MNSSLKTYCSVLVTWLTQRQYAALHTRRSNALRLMSVTWPTFSLGCPPCVQSGTKPARHAAHRRHGADVPSDVADAAAASGGSTSTIRGGRRSHGAPALKRRGWRRSRRSFQTPVAGRTSGTCRDGRPAGATRESPRLLAGGVGGVGGHRAPSRSPDGRPPTTRTGAWPAGCSPRRRASNMLFIDVAMPTSRLEKLVERGLAVDGVHAADLADIHAAQRLIERGQA